MSCQGVGPSKGGLSSRVGHLGSFQALGSLLEASLSPLPCGPLHGAAHNMETQKSHISTSHGVPLLSIHDVKEKGRAELKLQ
jgi:hypothetical protein